MDDGEAPLGWEGATPVDGEASAPKHGSAETYVYEALRAAIATGRLRPGQNFTESEIAKWFQVSRTPVRAATKLLEDQRLLTRTPGLGLSVTALTAEQLDDIYSTRSVLMGLATRLAALRMTAREWVRLQALQDEMDALVEAADFARLVKVNDAFHEQVIAGSKSESLNTLLGQIHVSIVPYRHSTQVLPGRAAEAMQEHHEMIRAIMARDEAAAEAIGRAHVVNAHLARMRQQAQLDVERFKGNAGSGTSDS